MSTDTPSIDQPPSESYLDHNASAPLLPGVADAVQAAFAAGPGNPSSAHGAGRRLRGILETARESVAGLVGARPAEVVFTSGATESNGLALRGLWAPGREAGALVTTRAEHPSVARTADGIEAEGRAVRRAAVDGRGRVEAPAVLDLVDDRTALVAMVFAEPVTGALEPVAEVAAGLPDGIPLHTDGAQAAGRVRLDVAALGAHSLALSAHKMGGPAGIGALWLREGVALRNPLTAGSQEMARRPGTEAVALAAGFGAAARAVRGTEEAFEEQCRRLLAPLMGFVTATEGGEILSPAAGRLPNTLAIAFQGCPGEALAAALDGRGVRVSTGTACSSGARTPPDVLVAGGRDPGDAARALRVSVGRGTRMEDVVALLGALRAVLPRVRAAGLAG